MSEDPAGGLFFGAPCKYILCGTYPYITNKWSAVANILVPYSSELPKCPDDADRDAEDDDYIAEIDKVLLLDNTEPYMHS
jgi:hypothetical protein